MARLRHLVQYGNLRLVSAVFNLLPHGVSCRIGSGLAWLAYRVFGWRRATTIARIREVFGPTMTKPEADRIGAGAARHLGLNLVELSRVRRGGGHWVRDLVDDQGTIAQLRALRAEGKGVLLVVAHLDNWDLGCIYFLLEQIPVSAIARPQRNPYTNRFINQARSELGANILSRNDPHLVRRVLERLAAGDVVAVLVDLRAKQPGKPFTYLGRPAQLANGLGLLAATSGAPVLPVAGRRIGLTRHQWTPLEVTRFDPTRDRKAERRRILQHCLDQLSPQVLAHPECYFWVNKRWVLEPFPPEADAIGDEPQSPAVQG